MNTPNSNSKSTLSSSSSASTTNNNNNPIGNKINSTNFVSSDSPAVQDSPVYNYISNLSPIQPVKGAVVSQGFPGLSSPTLVFESPRIHSLRNVFNRKLQSSASASEFSKSNDKCQKTAEDSAGSTNIDHGLYSPLSNQKGCNTNNLELFPHCSPSGSFGDFFANTMECSNFLPKIQSDDVQQDSQVGSLGKQASGTDSDEFSYGSTPLRVPENTKAKSRINIKIVKNEAQHLRSASSESSGVITKLSIGRASELCQTGDSFSEGNQFERGSLRRCLFDEKQRMLSADGTGSRSPNDNLIRNQKVVNMPFSGTSRNDQMVNLSKPPTGTSVSPLAGNCPVSTSLGIGLHLNSIIYPRTDSIIAGQQSSEKVVTEKGNSSEFVKSNQPAGKVNACSISSNSNEQVPASSEERCESKVCSVAASGGASDNVEQFISPIVSKTDDPTECEKKDLSSEVAESNEKLNQTGPKLKRKKPSSTTDDETSKRCKCKKSKCLKLYCDCFAAGLYCGESCACQGCSNRPEQEDTVLETRRQIESRNPLAFVPKVVAVQQVTKSPAYSEEVMNLSTPSSTRHKRGCNCKKSMCLKKYCECYQSNVGCSESCRCEGCKNIYGIKEGYYSIAREFSSKEVTEATPGEVLNPTQEVIAVSSNNVNTKVPISPNVTPVTPALLGSDQRKNALKSRLPPQRFLQSPDPHHEMSPSNEVLQACENSGRHSILAEENGGTSLDVNPLDSDRLLLTSGNMCTNTSQSVSTVTSALETRDLMHASHPKTFTRSGLHSPSAPLTPATQPVLPKNHQNYEDSGSKQNGSVVGDDTPNILQGSGAPTESVKVRSPNKKRITPPHTHTDSPETLRSSRKFVLKAVGGGGLPKFPSPSPYPRNNGVDNSK